MITHVAAAGEDRGRVVLRLSPLAAPSPVALDAAVRVAQAFGAEIESLFIEDRQLVDLAAFSFVRETTPSGGATRALAAGDVDRDMRALGRDLQADVADIARRAGVACRARSVRDEPMRALAQACAESGPWNMVAIGEPLGAGGASEIADIFAGVDDMTGILVVAPGARAAAGPVVIAVEALERLQPTLRAAARIAGVLGGDIRMVLVAIDPELVAWMEAEARQMLEPGPVRIAAVQLASDGDSARRMLSASAAGFVIAGFGGTVAPADHEPLSASLDCPLLLVR